MGGVKKYDWEREGWEDWEECEAGSGEVEECGSRTSGRGECEEWKSGGSRSGRSGARGHETSPARTAWEDWEDLEWRSGGVWE